MKNSVNFAQSFSDAQRSYKRWIVFSGFLLVGTVGVIGLLTFVVMRQRAMLAHELSLLKKKSIIQGEQAVSFNEEDPNQLKHQKIIRIKRAFDNPAIYLREIAQRIPDNVRIVSLRREPEKQVEINGQAKAIGEISSFVQAIKQSRSFDFCAIKSIDPQKDLVNFSLTAHLRK